MLTSRRRTKAGSFARTPPPPPCPGSCCAASRRRPCSSSSRSTRPWRNPTGSAATAPAAAEASAEQGVKAAEESPRQAFPALRTSSMVPLEAAWTRWRWRNRWDQAATPMLKVLRDLSRSRPRCVFHPCPVFCFAFAL